MNDWQDSLVGQISQTKASRPKGQMILACFKISKFPMPFTQALPRQRIAKRVKHVLLAKGLNTTE